METAYHKYKDTQDNWRKRNQDKINEYYRNRRLQKKKEKEDEMKKQIILEYISNLKV